MYQQFKKYEKFQKKVLTFRGRGDMIVNVAGSCGGDARKKFERTKTFQKKLKKFLTKVKRYDIIQKLLNENLQKRFSVK